MSGESNPFSEQTAEQSAVFRAHIPALDGVRGLAILMVMLFHFLPYGTPGQPWAIRAALLGIHVGQTGVDLFFVLSGFLITGILLDTKSNAHYFRNFYARRTLRIFPLYYGSLLLFMILLPNFTSLFHPVPVRQQLWLWFYARNIADFARAPAPAGHFWSLAVEEHFYLLWPAVVFFFNRKSLAGFCVVVMIVAMLTRGTLLAAGFSEMASLTPCRMDGLAAGAFLAAVLRGPNQAKYDRRLAWLMLLSLAIPLLPLYVTLSGTTLPIVQSVKYSLLSLFYAGLLLLVLRARIGSLVARIFTSSPLRVLGKYSYGLYVFHGLLLGPLLKWFPLASAEESQARFLASCAVRLAGCFAISFACAWISWHAYEKHFLMLKKRFDSSPRPVAHAADPRELSAP